jgi:uncharacterized protein YhaN
MRLKRVEAVRFGRIDGRSLGDLSEGLTIVHGPNEAGKSSFTALVRHALYGFPTRSEGKEAAYLSAAGDREVRLVFADGDREWIVQRSHAPKGGTLTVTATDGTRRDNLIAELTAGVSRQAYRVVLGFGVSELAALEELKGKDEDLISHLYAAGAGIGGTLIDAQKSLAAGMEALWKKGGSTPELNRARSERDKLRAEVRRLESESESLRAQAARLDEAVTELDAAKLRRAETQAAADRIGRALAEAGKLRESADEASAAAARLERDAAIASEEARAVATDPAALAVADEVDALVEELSGFRAQLDAIAAAQSRLDGVESRIHAALADTGWTEELALAAASDAGVGPELESFRERLAKARARVEMAHEGRDRAKAGEAAAQPVAPARSWLVPGIVSAALGAAAVAAGLVMHQTALTVFGAVLLLAGIGFALIRPSRAASGASAGSLSAAADVEATAASQALETVVAEWDRWVRSRGLGTGSDEPAAVAARYAAARSAVELNAGRGEVLAALERAESSATAFARRAAALCAPLLGEPVTDALERTAELVNRARARVAAARAADQVASEKAVAAAALARDAEEAGMRAADLRARAAASLSAACASEDEDVARAAQFAARAEAEEAGAAYDRLAVEVTELRTLLGSQGRENALADLRLAEEAAVQRIGEGARDYVELALASRILGLARERFERDRQPAVVKNAEAAFVRMTGGRYSRVAVPLGGDSIEVFDQAGAVSTASLLSTGTAEQLYLALRIGLIDQLGEVGASLPILMDDIVAHFDPVRAREAAGAIAELAQRRQVVFFTCHPGTADLLAELAPDAVRLELQPGC